MNISLDQTGANPTLLSRRHRLNPYEHLPARRYPASSVFNLYSYLLSFEIENALDPACFLPVVPEQVTTVHLTIQPKQTPEETLAGAQNEGAETQENLDRSGESELVPKAGLYQRGLLKSLMTWAIPSPTAECS